MLNGPTVMRGTITRTARYRLSVSVTTANIACVTLVSYTGGRDNVLTPGVCGALYLRCDLLRGRMPGLASAKPCATRVAAQVSAVSSHANQLREAPCPAWRPRANRRYARWTTFVAHYSAVATLYLLAALPAARHCSSLSVDRLPCTAHPAAPPSPRFQRTPCRVQVLIIAAGQLAADTHARLRFAGMALMPLWTFLHALLAYTVTVRRTILRLRRTRFAAAHTGSCCFCRRTAATSAYTSRQPYSNIVRLLPTGLRVQQPRRHGHSLVTYAVDIPPHTPPPHGRFFSVRAWRFRLLLATG